ARAGQSAGLTTVHYGPERDLMGEDLPTLLASAATGDESVVEFLGNPVFKVLVLATRASAAFTGSLLSPLPLAREARDLPRSRRDRVPALEQRLLRTSPDS